VQSKNSKPMTSVERMQAKETRALAKSPAGKMLANDPDDPGLELDLIIDDAEILRSYDLDRLAKEVVYAKRRSVTEMFRAGAALKVAKGRLPHGAWLPWLKKIGYNARTAERDIDAAILIFDVWQARRRLDIGDSRRFSSLNDVRAEARAIGVLPMSANHVAGKSKSSRTARSRPEKPEEHVHCEHVAELEAEIANRDDKIARLTAEINRLTQRPTRVPSTMSERQPVTKEWSARKAK